MKSPLVSFHIPLLQLLQTQQLLPAKSTTKAEDQISVLQEERGRSQDLFMSPCLQLLVRV